MPKSITITLTDKEYAIAVKESKKRGLNLAQYCKRFAIGDEDFDTSYEILKEKAVNFPPNIPFTVMSLFEDWELMERGVKLSLGRNFYHLVKRGDLPPVTVGKKNTSGIQQYIVKK